MPAGCLFFSQEAFLPAGHKSWSGEGIQVVKGCMLGLTRDAWRKGCLAIMRLRGAHAWAMHWPRQRLPANGCRTAMSGCGCQSPKKLNFKKKSRSYGHVANWLKPQAAGYVQSFHSHPFHADLCGAKTTTTSTSNPAPLEDTARNLVLAPVACKTEQRPREPERDEVPHTGGPASGKTSGLLSSRRPTMLSFQLLRLDRGPNTPQHTSPLCGRQTQHPRNGASIRVLR